MKEVKYLCQRLVENVDTLEKYVDTGEAKDEYNVDMEIDEEFAIRWKSIKKAERPIAVVTALPKKQRSGELRVINKAYIIVYLYKKFFMVHGILIMQAIRIHLTIHQSL